MQISRQLQSNHPSAATHGSSFLCSHGATLQYLKMTKLISRSCSCRLPLSDCYCCSLLGELALMVLILTMSCNVRQRPRLSQIRGLIYLRLLILLSPGVASSYRLSLQLIQRELPMRIKE